MTVRPSPDPERKRIRLDELGDYWLAGWRVYEWEPLNGTAIAYVVVQREAQS